MFCRIHEVKNVSKLDANLGSGAHELAGSGFRFQGWVGGHGARCRHSPSDPPSNIPLTLDVPPYI